MATHIYTSITYLIDYNEIRVHWNHLIIHKILFSLKQSVFISLWSALPSCNLIKCLFIKTHSYKLSLPYQYLWGMYISILACLYLVLLKLESDNLCSFRIIHRPKHEWFFRIRYSIQLPTVIIWRRLTEVGHLSERWC